MREPYLGLGPSAHSFDGRFRRANTPSVRRWAQALEHGRPPLDFKEELTPDQARMEEIMLGLRLTEGLPVSSVRETAALEDLIGAGFLFIEGQRLKPTPKGLLAADRLAAKLI